MIDVQIDTKKQIAKIEKMLGEFSENAPKVLAYAVNATAKAAKKGAVKDVKKLYRERKENFQKADFDKAIRVDRASTRNPTARIDVTGYANQLGSFKINPRMPNRKERDEAKKNDAKLEIKKYKSGAAVKGAVRVETALKELKQKGADVGGKDLKAFVTQFSSGHVAVVCRQPGKSPKEPKYASQVKWGALRVLYTTDMAHMIGSARGTLEKGEMNTMKIQEILADHVEKEVKRHLILQAKKQAQHDA